MPTVELSIENPEPMVGAEAVTVTNCEGSGPVKLTVCVKVSPTAQIVNVSPLQEEPPFVERGGKFVVEPHELK